MIDNLVQDLDEATQATMARGMRFSIEDVSDGVDIVHWDIEPKVERRLRRLMAKAGVDWDDVMHEVSEEIMYLKLQQQRARRRRHCAMPTPRLGRPVATETVTLPAKRIMPNGGVVFQGSPPIADHLQATHELIVHQDAQRCLHYANELFAVVGDRDVYVCDSRGLWYELRHWDHKHLEALSRILDAVWTACHDECVDHGHWPRDRVSKQTVSHSRRSATNSPQSAIHQSALGNE